MIIAEDGIWDALSSEMAAKACRGLPAELAAKFVVKEALRASGLKDDTTCLVVDIEPSDHSASPPSPMKNQNKLRCLFLSLRTPNYGNKRTKKLSSVGSVKKLFEDGSAMLEERLVTNFPSKVKGKLITLSMCNLPNRSSTKRGTIIVHTKFVGRPLSLYECRKKQEAVEGKGE